MLVTKLYPKSMRNIVEYNQVWGNIKTNYICLSRAQIITFHVYTIIWLKTDLIFIVCYDWRNMLIRIAWYWNGSCELFSNNLYSAKHIIAKFTKINQWCEFWGSNSTAVSQNHSAFTFRVKQFRNKDCWSLSQKALLTQPDSDTSLTTSFFMQMMAYQNHEFRELLLIFAV
jgi:hypothetical protein